MKTGGCLCGAVTYEVRGDLRPVIACHCYQCRRTSGHYVASTQTQAEDLTIRGEGLTWFRSSDIAERGFCSRCGSNLFWREFGSEDISIWAGTLDGVTGLRMTGQIYADSAGDYYDLPDVPIIDPSELP